MPNENAEWNMADHVLFPAHVFGNHWVLCVVSFRRKEVVVLDSLTHKALFIARDVRDFVHYIDRIVKKLQMELPRDLPDGDWKIVTVGKDLGLPVQSDGAACGAYVCYYIRNLWQKPPAWTFGSSIEETENKEGDSIHFIRAIGSPRSNL